MAVKLQNSNLSCEHRRCRTRHGAFKRCRSGDRRYRVRQGCCRRRRRRSCRRRRRRSSYMWRCRSRSGSFKRCRRCDRRYKIRRRS
ncbi:hypothetical protein O3G_MSEX013715 [Manduca sexta]|uniref:Uncharacterized protein n=1 Tax=Manduca sexta TaxID=7130 RepID=A0A921ZSX0_MANSE|nr:hypothetical protein O3G_MSEX013715 [Manduca sexta]